MKQVFIITGTRKGIGQALAQHYLEAGNIVCGCSRGEPSIDHPAYSHYALDVVDEPAVVHMIRAVVQQHGRIDVLVNNAGIARMNPLLLSPTQDVTNIFQTNFHGTFLFSREVAKVMLRQKSGRIVNMTTVAKPLRLEGEGLYAASKAAIESFTQLLAREVGRSGITVNAIGPSPLPTDLIAGVSDETMQALLQRQAVPEFATVDDVRQVVDFFISPHSRMITGQIIYLGGVFG